MVFLCIYMIKYVNFYCILIFVKYFVIIFKEIVIYILLLMKCIKYFLIEYLCVKFFKMYIYDVVEIIDFYLGYL